MKYLAKSSVLLTVIMVNVALCQQQEVEQKIREALVRDFCYQIYWGDEPTYKVDTPLPIKIRLDGKKFRACLLDPDTLFRNSMLDFIEGIVGDTEAYVVNEQGFNEALWANDPRFEKEKSYFQTGNVIHTTITIPSGWTPKFSPTSPRKKLMLATIVNTMKELLSQESGIWNYSRIVTLIIANFNVDYGMTYVLLKPSDGYLYEITLHDVNDYMGDDFEKEGTYPYAERRLSSVPKSLVAKIYKHAIIRKINLTP